MKKFHLTLLGTNSAAPVYGRINSCQILNYDYQLVLIDCGEACQIRLLEYKIKTSKINTICISHLHGDHVFGLPGVLGSFSHNGRKELLTIIGPEGIREMMESILKHSHTFLNYPIEFIELNHGNKQLVSSNSLDIYAFPLKHRAPTYGYLFVEKQNQIKFNKAALEEHKISIDEIKKLKNGHDIIRQDGSSLKFLDIVLPQAKSRTYAYCSDTIFDLDIVEHISGVDYIYHETTYLDDLKHLAAERMHSTAKEAGIIAKKAKAFCLITGHYSSRYRYVDELAAEARKEFPNVIKGYDGLMIELNLKMPKNLLSEKVR